MFRVRAASVEEYFGFDPLRSADLRAADALIRAGAPSLARWFVAGTAAGKPGMAMTMIGYGSFEYAVRGAPEHVRWPIVGLALQKNYLSLYLAAEQDGRPFAEPYADRLGKVDISTTGAARFTSTADLDPAVLTAMLRDLERGLASAAVRVRYSRNTTTVAVQDFPAVR